MHSKFLFFLIIIALLVAAKIHSVILLNDFFSLTKDCLNDKDNRVVIQDGHPIIIPNQTWDEACDSLNQEIIPLLSEYEYNTNREKDNFIARRELRLSLESEGIAINPGIDLLLPLNSTPLTLSDLKFVLNPEQRQAAKITAYNQLMQPVCQEIYQRIGGKPTFEFAYDSTYSDKSIAVIELYKSNTSRSSLLRSCLDLQWDTSMVSSHAGMTHDQWVVSIIRCLAPKSKIKQYSLINTYHFASESLKSVADKQDVLLINLSLGPEKREDYASHMYSRFKESLTYAINKGKVIVVSAGNEELYLENTTYGQELLDFATSINEDPLSKGKLVIVGGTRTTEEEYEKASSRFNFSHNPQVIYAPGEKVPVLNTENNKEYHSGTSFSAPIVTAILFNLATTFYNGDCLKAVDVLKRTTFHGTGAKGGGIVNAQLAYREAHQESLQTH